jgi:hypothetical protein
VEGHKEQEEPGGATPPPRTWARSITLRSTMRGKRCHAMQRNTLATARVSWHMPGCADVGPEGMDSLQHQAITRHLFPAFIPLAHFRRRRVALKLLEHLGHASCSVPTTNSSSTALTTFGGFARLKPLTSSEMYLAFPLLIS